MSNCKEGEGLYYIDSVITKAFTSGQRYTIILLGDNEIRIVTQATFGVPNEDDDVRLFNGDGRGMVMFRLPFFSSDFINSFDLIIRDDEKTLEMLPNIIHTR